MATKNLYWSWRSYLLHGVSLLVLAFSYYQNDPSYLFTYGLIMLNYIGVSCVWNYCLSRLTMRRWKRKIFLLLIGKNFFYLLPIIVVFFNQSVFNPWILIGGFGFYLFLLIFRF